jgi:hypothetical protein
LNRSEKIANIRQGDFEDSNCSLWPVCGNKKEISEEANAALEHIQIIFSQDQWF